FCSQSAGLEKRSWIVANARAINDQPPLIDLKAVSDRQFDLSAARGTPGGKRPAQHPSVVRLHEAWAKQVVAMASAVGGPVAEQNWLGVGVTVRIDLPSRFDGLLAVRAGKPHLRQRHQLWRVCGHGIPDIQDRSAAMVLHALLSDSPLMNVVQQRGILYGYRRKRTMSPVVILAEERREIGESSEPR